MTRRKKDEAAIEAAWKIHEAQTAWTTAVDAKASFSFGLQAAVIAAVGGLVASGRVFDDLHNRWIWLLVGGGAALVMGLLFAASVVAPRLRTRNLKRESRTNYIYFGHLRYWRGKNDLLEQRLRHDDLLPLLTRQLTNMAEIAWTKHRRVQVSIWCGVIGGGLLLCYAILNTIPHPMRP